MTENQLVGLVRDEFNKIQRLEATTNRFQSERNISYENALIYGPGWLPDRVMQDIPLYLSDERVSERIFTDDKGSKNLEKLRFASYSPNTGLSAS